jgi:hypothetical protein
MKLRLLGTVAFVSLLTAACGAAPKHAKSAEAVPETAEGSTSASPNEDMPPAPAAKQAEAAPPPASADTPPLPTSEASGGMIKIAPMTLTTAKAQASSVKLESDGTIKIDGKPAAKVKGDEVTSTRGTSMVTIGIDGSLVGSGVKAGYKLEGYDLIGEGGLRVNVGDDGTLTASRDGKSEAVGKADGAGTSKRTALILAALYLDVPSNPGEVKPSKAEKASKKGKKKGKKKS